MMRIRAVDQSCHEPYTNQNKGSQPYHPTLEEPAHRLQFGFGPPARLNAIAEFLR